jgi:hypothetical protein
VNAGTNRWVIAPAVAALILGAILSRVIEPGVRVEKIMLATNTPALRLFPATPGPHPIVLLAHGNGGSKETLFRYGEALAAAGFDCYSVDQAGYGESPQRSPPFAASPGTSRVLGGWTSSSAIRWAVAGEWSVLEGISPKALYWGRRPGRWARRAAGCSFGRFEEFDQPRRNGWAIVFLVHHILEYDPSSQCRCQPRASLLAKRPLPDRVAVAIRRACAGNNSIPMFACPNSPRPARTRD